MPAIELTPSSTFLVTSLSTTSGDAPGYPVCTTTTGKSMLGNWSTFRRWSENRPSTTSASMTMVAKTGFFRLTRVNHMGGSDAGCGARRRNSGIASRRRGHRAGEAHRRASAQRAHVAADHGRALGDAFHADPGLVLGVAARAHLDGLVRHLAVLDQLHVRQRLVRPH